MQHCHGANSVSYHFLLFDFHARYNIEYVVVYN